MTHQPDQHACVQRLGAFTLIELLLALALCSVVALLVAMMLAGVSSATHAANDTRHAVMARQVAAVRIGALTRTAAVVLATDASRIVLWKGDLNGDAKPNLSELRRVAWDAASGEVRSAESPADLNPALDESFALTTDFLAVTASLAGSTSFPEKIVFQHVVQWSVGLDNPVVRSARLMKISVTINSDHGDDRATIVSALRVEGDAS